MIDIRNAVSIFIIEFISILDLQYLHSSLTAVLSDFEDASNHLEDNAVKREVNLVADSLRLGGAILGKLIGDNIKSTFPETFIYKFIRSY